MIYTSALFFFFLQNILGDDHHEAIKLPEQLFGLPSQHNHTVDGPGRWGGYPNTLQNYGHKPSVEHLLQYLAATTNGHRLPHPLTSLSPSSIDASGFGSTTNNRVSCLPDASVAFNAPPGFQTQFKDLNPFPGQVNFVDNPPSSSLLFTLCLLDIS